MNVSEEIVKLIEAVVEKKVNAQMLKVKSIVSAGDLSLTGMGNVRLQTGIGKKAYYNGTEIGTGSGYLPLTAGSSKALTGGLYLKAASYAGTGAYIVNDVDGNIELHVPTDKAIKIIVG